MIDFHTHILPHMDDGSKNTEESVAIFNSIKSQGIKRIIATPHFYANDESVDEFIARRNRSYSSLIKNVPQEPEIILGAEVKYYEGISRLEGLHKLCIEGSKLLLLEMPFSQWSEYTIREIIDIACQGNITLVLAHVERYIFMQKSGVALTLLENGILFQSNASFFTGTFTRRKAIKMLKRNQIHFIGSDCHNMQDRAPNTKEAVLQIEKKCGIDFAEDFMNYGDELFLHNKSSLIFHAQ